MAHFAKMYGNTVKQVIVISNDDVDNLSFPDSEPVGQAFIASIGLDGDWLETSYNNNFRGTFAGVGCTYDAELDEFIAPVFPSEE